MKKSQLLWIVLSVCLLTPPPASATDAQETNVASIARLNFLVGNWLCTVRGGAMNGVRQEVDYSLSPDGLWMTEVSQNSNDRSDDWAVQMWGYDTRTQRLVAYNFARNGVTTKTIDGWVGKTFKSHRDDNGAIVSLESISQTAMQWTIESADGSSSVYEDCIKR